MNALTIMIFIGLLWGIKELIYGTILWYQRRKIRHNLRVETTERHFAEVRNELMRLALKGEVNVNTASFKSVYFITTALMRRPDQYPAMSAAIAYAFVRNRDAEPDEELSRESKDWSPAFRELFKSAAKAMDYIVLDYSWSIRFGFWLEKGVNPDSTPRQMLSRWAKEFEKKEKAISDIRRTQKVMYMMAAL